MGANFPNYEKRIRTTEYLSQNMFHDVLHRLEAKNRQKIFEHFFQNFSQVNDPTGAKIFRILKNTSKILNIVHKTCFITFYIH